MPSSSSSLYLLFDNDILLFADRNFLGVKDRPAFGIADGAEDRRALSEDEIDFFQVSTHGLRVEEEDGDRNAHSDDCVDDVVLVATKGRSQQVSRSLKDMK